MLESAEFIAAHRVQITDFTRRRTLTAPTLVACLATGFLKGLQSELDDFFGRLRDKAGFVRVVSKSAFSQARKKLKPSAFKALNTLLLDRWYRAVAVPRWHGFRLVAGDTTTLRVPNLPETVAEFGLHGGGRGEAVPMAMAFGLYEVVSGMMLHAELHGAGSRDRDLLACSLEHVRPDDLLLLDRGFPAYWLLAWMLQHRRAFCIRVDAMDLKAFETFTYRSDKLEEIVTVDVPAAAARKAAARGYPLECTTFQVRLIRVPLPGGKQEILVTSLLDSDAYPAPEFGDLYHRRWRIEECFKLLKCRLAVEHFSGELPDCVRQDFLAKVWLGNLTATFAYLAHASLDTAKRAHFVPNLTYAVAAIRAALPRLLLRVKGRIRMLKAILDLAASTLEWLRPDRHYPRDRQAVKPIRYRAYKPIR
jgi:hypothetical protein